MIARHRWLVVGVGLLALAGVACDRGRERARAGRSSLTVSYPAWDDLFIDSSVQFLLFLPLVTRNAKGELEGRLADRWEHSPDYRTWTIHLRTDVKWQDGVPVTAHDIKFTLDLLSHPGRAAGWVPPGAFSLTVLDDSTYRITYHKQAMGGGGRPPGAGSPLDDYTVYYPRHLLENLDPKDFHRWDFWTHPVGNGPYRYVRHVPKTMMEFEANPEYYRGKPKIERVVLKFFAGEHAPLTELLAGNADALYIEEMDLLKVADDPRFHPYFEISPQWLLRAIAWNHRDPLFRDPRVRRALTLAINRRELHRALNLPEGIPIFDVVPPERQFHRGELPEPLPFDPETANHLLDQAGWRDTGGDGVRGDQNGKAFRFTALAAPQWGLEKAVVYIQSQLRRVGIQMDVSITEHGVVRERVKAGKFQAAMFGVNQKLTSPVGLVALFGRDSLIGYSSPRVIALLDTGRTTVDPDGIDRMLRDLMPIFQADLPVTFLYPNVGTTLASRRIRGLSSPYRADLVRYMEELWIESE